MLVEVACDNPAGASRLQQQAIPESVAHGRTLDLSRAHYFLAIARFREGALLDAEASARTSWEIMRVIGVAAATAYWWSKAALSEILIARGELEEAAALLETSGLGSERLEVVIFPWPPVLRGELALAQGRTVEGAETLLEAGNWLEQRGFTNPAYIPWRAVVAPALARLGRHEEARAVIGPAVQRARLRLTMGARNGAACRWHRRARRAGDRVAARSCRGARALPLSTRTRLRPVGARLHAAARKRACRSA